MKTFKTTAILLCISIFTSYAQNIIYEEIQQAKNVENFRVFSSLSLVNSRNALSSKKITDHFFDPQEVYMLQYNPAQNMDASMTYQIPLGGKDLLLEIQEVIIDYQLTTSDGHKIMPNKNNRHYQGVV